MRSVYTVAQVNSYIKNMFVQDYMLQSILVKGEISNCKYHSSGHIYFTLKDGLGTIACVMFAGNRKGLDFSLQEGMQVIVGGTVDVYERDGKYQLYARQITRDGFGLLYERFERLKADLEERGMFAAEYKQTIPKYIKTLGVVTAPTGAAVRDIIQVTQRRNPYVQIILYPAIVQGDAAAESIVNGIHALEQMDVDVIIVGRGGGSIEDLWAFNEEIVAQAVFDCSIPIISAVGHETDTTIVDYVADLRAPTPSAAAEQAVYEYELLMERFSQYENRLKRQMSLRIQDERQRAGQMGIRLKYNSPLNRLRQKQTYAMQLEEKLQRRMERRMREYRHRMEVYIEKMKGLSPLDKLSQGFAYVTDEDGQALRSINQVGIGENIILQLKDGTIEAVVNKKEEKVCL